MKLWEVTDPGLVRSDNQDAYATAEIAGFTVAVVCDGMGGTAGGRIASTTAVDTVMNELNHALRQDMDEVQLNQAVLYAIACANDAIHQRSAEDEELSKMGTTLVCALCRPNGETLLCNIGDSRGYHLTGDGIVQITRDHSVVENMVEQGELTQAQARRHPNRNLITRALGPDEVVQADTFTLTLHEGEFLLLCTDGLVNTVSEQEMLFEVIHESDLDSCLERLLEISRDNGAPDNVTVVLMKQ